MKRAPPGARVKPVHFSKNGRVFIAIGIYFHINGATSLDTLPISFWYNGIRL